LQKWKVASRSRQRRVRFQLRNRCSCLATSTPKGSVAPAHIIALFSFQRACRVC
jgi:hypothetical protein